MVNEKIREKHREYFKERNDFVEILNKEEIIKNCNLCPSRRKLSEKINDDDNINDLFKKGKLICKYCLITIAKRKIVMNYIIEYFQKYNVKQFTINNLINFIKNKDKGEYVCTSVRLVIKDLEIMNIVKELETTSKKKRYALVSNLKKEKISDEVLVRAFGNEYGIKSTKTKI